MTRRDFIKSSLHVAGGIILSSLPTSVHAAIPSLSRGMHFYHTHTGERLRVDISDKERYPLDPLKVNRFFRDFRTSEIHPIDPELLSIINAIRRETGSSGIIEVISAYRSPKTNKVLRSRSGGVAKKSLHMKGKALDIRISDLDSGTLRDVAIALKKGGVGYYAKSDFVHIDTGRVRYW